MEVTLAALAALPVHPVIPVNDVSVTPVYAQGLLTASTLNEPVVGKPAVELTFSDAPRTCVPVTVVTGDAAVTPALLSGEPVQPTIPVKVAPLIPV